MARTMFKGFVRFLWVPILLMVLLAFMPRPAHAAFDAQHTAFNALLAKHVIRVNGGNASQVQYAGFAQDRAALKAYLDSASMVPRAEFEGWSAAQRMAFLINAYNAYTIELVLTKYPDLQSIKDIGSFVQSPWKKKFFPLFGAPTSLDDIEQGMLRKRGAYDDPRLHFALNCASIGCPMLLDVAYTAERLDAQLDAQAERFMADRSRNRFNAATGQLEVSKIFDWYADDFRLGHKGIASPTAFFARYAGKLSDVLADQQKLRAQTAGVGFLEYDWRLNDARRAPP